MASRQIKILTKYCFVCNENIRIPITKGSSKEIKLPCPVCKNELTIENIYYNEKRENSFLSGY